MKLRTALAGVLACALIPSLAIAQARPLTVTRDAAITTGGTAQVLMAANPDRRAIFVWNPDASEALWCSFSGTAAANGQGSFLISPGAVPLSIQQNAPTQALSCIAATTAHKITAWETQ